MKDRRGLDDLDDEIREHLDRETAVNIARGMAPDEARATARRAFGNIIMTKENARAVWIPIWIDRVLQDLRYAARMFRRSPAFTATLVITLALGIGMNTAVFSVVNAVLLRPLSYAHPERLVWIAAYDDRTPTMDMIIAPDYLAWRDHATSLDRVVAFSIGTERIEGRTEVVAARVATISPEFWNLTAAVPALGRLPAAGEDAIMLSDGFFERAFARDASVIGRPIAVNGRQVPIAGVLPRAFHPELPPPIAAAQLGPGALDAYHVSVVRAPAPTDPGIRLFSVIARLKPGVTIERAASELAGLRVSAASLGGRPRPPHLRVIPYADKLVGGARTPLMILLAAVLFVLAIACANIANLLLVRGSARRREIAIRVAVGAGRSRVVQQFVVESLLLAAVGVAGGLLVARAGLALMLALIPYALPRLSDTTIDGSVLAFALALSAATALVFGVVPAIAVWRSHPQESLQLGARAAPSASRTRSALVIAEIALASVLLVGAALTIKSLWRIAAPPPGFAPEHVLTMKFQPNPRREYTAEVIHRAQAVPGVIAAGISSNGESRTILRIEGAPAVPNNQLPLVHLSVTSDGYASAIGMRVVKGRWFAEHEPERVCVVNEALARTHFAGSDPIGRRILLATGPNSGEYGTVVGVVSDLRYANLEAPPEPELFVDYEHSPLFALNLAIRTRDDPMAIAPAVRTSLRAIDPTRPIFDVKTLESVLIESIAPRRFNVFLLGTFAATALLLAVIGIYGVMAYSVAQRTHEIGVRMALGAERGTVVAMVIRQGMTLACTGMTLGAAAALATSRVMTGLLYEVRPTDPAPFVSAIGALGAAALIACCLPARKASRVDPTIALRCE